MKKTGIYKITNVITGKVYIGSTTNFKNRWSSHICRLKNNTHHSIKLQNSVNKHNIENFKFEVLEECAKGVRCRKKVENYLRRQRINYLK